MMSAAGPTAPVYGTRTTQRPIACVLTVLCLAGSGLALELPASRGGEELIGKQLPPLAGTYWLNTPDHQPPDLGGKIVFIRFWNHDCPSCRDSAPAVQELHDLFGSQGVAVLAIYYPGSPKSMDKDDVSRYAERFGLRTTIGIDEKWADLKALWLTGPKREAKSASFLADHYGVIRYVHPGPEFHASEDPAHRQCNQDLLDIKLAVETLIQEREDERASQPTQSTQAASPVPPSVAPPAPPGSRGLQVAAVHVRIGPDIEGNAQAIIQALETESRLGTRLVVFEECALSGHDPGSIGRLSPAQIDRAVESISRACRQHEVYAVVGSAYTDLGKWYSGAYVIDPAGRVIKRHAALSPARPEFFAEGRRLAIFRIDGMPATVLVGQDYRHPEVARIPALAGARLGICLGCASSAGGEGGHSLCSLITRAVENQMAIVHCGAGGPGPAGASGGHSRIIDPGGKVLAEAGPDAAQAIRAVIHPENVGSSQTPCEIAAPALRAFAEEGLRALREDNPEFFAAPPATKPAKP